MGEVRFHDRGQNRIEITAGGKTFPLRCTMGQMERWLALPAVADDGEATPMDRARRHVMRALDIAEIALNPLPNEMAWSREAINEAFDADQVMLLALLWVERKVFSPRLEADPNLGRPEK